MNGIVRRLVITGLCGGALVAAAGCAGNAPGQPATARLNAATKAATATASHAHAAAAASKSAGPAPAGSPSDAPAPVDSPSTATAAGYQGPHFTTPEAAMTYLTAAYNSDNAAALHAVTTPNSYQELMQMRSGAVNLQLLSCTADASRGDYFCDFRHDYPASLNQSGHGGSEMLIAPAQNPGWYLYAVVDCG